MAPAPEHWIEFYIRGKAGRTDVSRMIRIALRRPVRLYDDQPFSDYRVARAHAIRQAKAAAGAHPASTNRFLKVDPHDWSDSVDAHTQKEANRARFPQDA